MLRIRNTRFKSGYNGITTIGEKEDDTGMNFGIIKLEADDVYEDSAGLERIFLLIEGEVSLEWEGRKELVSRQSCFDENPVVLHLPKGVSVKITGIFRDSEVCAVGTENEREFPSRLFNKEECRSEDRGKGTMKEASTRIVRTVLDYMNGKHSNLVIGEVIDYPGKWSSYPPHYHPQPEIYFYKFYPKNGYGFCELGEEVLKLKNNDTVKILDNATHPQATAPGYAMYYIWVIRHLEGNPYINPTFVQEHLWVTDPKAKIWPDK